MFSFEWRSYICIHNSFLFRFIRNECGGAAVEVAVLLPLLLSGGLLFTDLYRIGMERTRLEQAAGSASITLSVQRKLGQAGLDGLYNTLFTDAGQGDLRDDHQLIITNVTMPSRRIWWSLNHGNSAICEGDTIGEGTYQGDLPEADDSGSEEADPADDTYSLMVVRLCRSTADIALTQLTAPEKLEVISINRTPTSRIDLDLALLEKATGAIHE